jgi:hypothetical protein
VARVLRASAAATALAALSVAGRAEATLTDDAAKVAALHQADGLTLERAETRFLEEGRTVEVALSSAGRCRTVTLIAARSVSFVAIGSGASESGEDLLAELDDAASKRRVESSSGLIQLSGCDGALERALVKMTSPRAALEVRASVGERVADDPTEVLGRAAGPVGVRAEVGPPLAVGAVSERRQRAELGAKADGATNVLASEHRADALGTGRVDLKANAGCHRYFVVAEAPEVSSALDVDAELRSAESGARLARDRGETPDARLDACFGKTTDVALAFAGAAPKGRVVVLDALFPLPEGIPEHWGDRARAGLASALRKRLRRGPKSGPIFETLGAQGSVVTAMPTEPGACYVAALGVARGAPRGMRLAVRTPPRAVTEEVPAGVDGASVTFCATSHDGSELRVDAPGAALGWVLSVWRLR